MNGLEIHLKINAPAHNYWQQDKKTFFITALTDTAFRGGGKRVTTPNQTPASEHLKSMLSRLCLYHLIKGILLLQNASAYATMISLSIGSVRVNNYLYKYPSCWTDCHASGGSTVLWYGQEEHIRFHKYIQSRQLLFNVPICNSFMSEPVLCPGQAC